MVLLGPQRIYGKPRAQATPGPAVRHSPGVLGVGLGQSPSSRCTRALFAVGEASSARAPEPIANTRDRPGLAFPGPRSMISAMPISVEELNATNCKTYLLSADGKAILVDPVRERLEDYRRVIAARGLTLTLVLETHTHADHLMLNRAAKEALGVPMVMHRESPSPLVDRHVVDGQQLELGGERIEVWHTPGHTPDSVCYRVPGAVLTGDTLLIGSSGRTDFPGGDAGRQFDAVTARLFALPDDTVVWPAHDYKGHTSSTIGEERRHNARFTGRTREAYVALMGGLGLPFPDKIQQALQVNQSGFESEEVAFPAVADVGAVGGIDAAALAARLGAPGAPLLVDVREPEEFVGELGHVAGALLVPLDALERRLPKLAGYVDREVVVICRAGARSATAAAILRRAGFARVLNLADGMLGWTAAGLPVQR
jgi:glyoxylase-like metal-dependent hydrolase (beta-lactamase superfamily II)/rhodanese-related sulfurtransferase